MTRRILIKKPGGAEVLQIIETETPQAGPGQVRIRVAASGINFADILARQGLYPDAPKPPCVVGYEVAGVVDQVGEGVPETWIEKPVLAITRFGGYSQHVCVPLGQVFEKPDSLTFEQAAALPVNYLTAYQLLVVMGNLRKDETALIHNAGSGVGLAALDLARHIGARTFGTASAAKHDFLKERGYDSLIDYRTEDWVRVIRERTDGKGVELVVDPIGGESWKKSYSVLRATGRLGMFGVSIVTESRWHGKLKFIKLIKGMPKFNPLHLMDGNRGVFGVNIAHMWDETEKVIRWMQEILRGVEAGWIRPHVDRTFPHDKVGEAHQYIEERRSKGKVILTWDEAGE